MRRCAILGSTGSIGRSTLALLGEHPELAEVTFLSAHRDFERLLQQIEVFRPSRAALTGRAVKKDEFEACRRLECELIEGQEGVLESLKDEHFDVVVLGISGAAGLEYGMAALEADSRLAIANKEPLVIAGQCFKKMEAQGGGEIVPVDSEHSAIFQCLLGSQPKDVEKLILTSSGGPFHHRQESFSEIRLEEALQHPTWSMGNKITIDSATMMNKALEMIEARWLFDISLSEVEVTVHRQSIVHSMVEFVDGSVMAQLGVTDMQYPILYAFTHPERFSSSLPRLSFQERMDLSFEPVNPFLQQAIDLAREFGEDPLRTIFLNAANEIYVGAFMKGQVPFDGVYDHIREVIGEAGLSSSSPQCIAEVLELDGMARSFSKRILKV